MIDTLRELLRFDAHSTCVLRVMSPTGDSLTTSVDLPELVRLVEIGLRREREVCGNCISWDDGLDERSQGPSCRKRVLPHPRDDEYCSDWGSKGGG